MGFCCKGPKDEGLGTAPWCLLGNARHACDKTGSLWLEEIEGRMSTQPQLFASASISLLGPFSSAKDTVEAVVRLQLRLSTTGEVSPLPLDSCLTSCWKLELILELCSTPTADRICPKSFTKHSDDKSGHILVDEDFSIRAILDWAFASTEIKEIALSSPCMIWSSPFLILARTSYL